MNIAFYSARTGMIAQQNGMDVTANNISNVNTVGYKALRPSFADCIYTHQRATEPEWDTGHGQFLNKTDYMWEQGGFYNSDQPLDFALGGDGFFMVRDYNGNDFLTRDGSFEISYIADLGHWELVNGNGDFVIDYEGNHITVPFETEIDEDGNEVETTNIDYGALMDMIGVYNVDNNWGLDQDRNNHFVVTARSGQPVPDLEGETSKIEYYLENSSVDFATEIVHVIESQRSYQMNARIVQTADEMQRIANNLR